MMCACPVHVHIQLMSDLPGPLKKFFYKFCLNKPSVQALIWAAGGKSTDALIASIGGHGVDTIMSDSRPCSGGFWLNNCRTVKARFPRRALAAIYRWTLEAGQ